jgi:hypothetical protein
MQEPGSDTSVGRDTPGRRVFPNFKENWAELRGLTGSRTMFRIAAGASYFGAAVGFRLVETDKVVSRPTAILLAASWLIGVAVEILLIARLRWASLLLILPWYRTPYLLWFLFGWPNSRPSPAAVSAWVFCCAGALVFVASSWLSVTPTR